MFFDKYVWAVKGKNKNEGNFKIMNFYLFVFAIFTLMQFLIFM